MKSLLRTKILFIGILLVTFISLNFVTSAMDPSIPYCERQGYKVIRNESIDSSYCVFNEVEKCKLWDFYSGTCGQEFVRPLPCVENGEPIFAKEKCCDGWKYPSRSLLKGFLGQSTCQPFSKIILFYLTDPTIWISLVIIILILFWISKKYTKH